VAPVLTIEAAEKTATEFARAGVGIPNPESPISESLLLATEEPVVAVVTAEIVEARRSWSVVLVGEDRSVEKAEEESRVKVDEETEPLHPADNPAMEACLVPMAAPPPHSAYEGGGGIVRGLGWAESGIPRPPFINIAPAFPPAVAPHSEDTNWELILPCLTSEVVAALDILQSSDMEAKGPRFPASLPHVAEGPALSVRFGMVPAAGGSAVFNPPESEMELPILAVAMFEGFGTAGPLDMERSVLVEPSFFLVATTSTKLFVEVTDVL
jgi:hypothetical protein